MKKIFEDGTYEKVAPSHWTYNGGNFSIPPDTVPSYNPSRAYRERNSSYRRDTHHMPMFPQKDWKSNRRRRSHLDDVFRSNFEDLDDEYFAQAYNRQELNGGIKNVHPCTSKMSNHFVQRNGQYSHKKNVNDFKRNTTNKPIINIKFNWQFGKTQNSPLKRKIEFSDFHKRIKGNLSVKDETKSNEKLVRPQKKLLDLTNEEFPKEEPRINSVNINTIKTKEKTHRISDEEMPIDLIETIPCIKQDNMKDSELVGKQRIPIPEDSLNSTREESIDLMAETKVSKESSPGEEVEKLSMDKNGVLPLKNHFNISTPAILIDLTDENKISEQILNEISQDDEETSTYSDDCFIISTQKISSDDESNGKEVISSETIHTRVLEDVCKGGTQEIEVNVYEEGALLKQTSSSDDEVDEVFGNSTQELLADLTGENQLPQVPPENVTLFPDLNDSKKGSLSDDEDKNSKISIPFLEHLISNESVAKVKQLESRCIMETSQDHTKSKDLAPEKYLMLCELSEYKGKKFQDKVMVEYDNCDTSILRPLTRHSINNMVSFSNTPEQNILIAPATSKSDNLSEIDLLDNDGIQSQRSDYIMTFSGSSSVLLMKKEIGSLTLKPQLSTNCKSVTGKCLNSNKEHERCGVIEPLKIRDIQVVQESISSEISISDSTKPVVKDSVISLPSKTEPRNLINKNEYFENDSSHLQIPHFSLSTLTLTTEPSCSHSTVLKNSGNQNDTNFISANLDTNTRSSDGFPLLDDYSVVDMDLGTPPSKRKSEIDFDEIPEKKRRFSKHSEITADVVIQEIEEISVNCKTPSLKKNHTKSSCENKDKSKEVEIKKFDNVEVKLWKSHKNTPRNQKLNLNSRTRNLINPDMKNTAQTSKSSSTNSITLSKKSIADLNNVKKNSHIADKKLRNKGDYNNEKRRSKTKRDHGNLETSKKSEKHPDSSKNQYSSGKNKVFTNVNKPYLVTLFGDDDENEYFEKQVIMQQLETMKKKCSHSSKLIDKNESVDKEKKRSNTTNVRRDSTVSLSKSPKAKKVLKVVCEDINKLDINKFKRRHHKRKEKERSNHSSKKEVNYKHHKLSFKSDSSSNPHDNSLSETKEFIKKRSSKSDESKTLIINSALQCDLPFFYHADMLSFTNLCRASADVIMNDCCDEGVTLDRPDIQETVEIAQNVEMPLDEVVEIKPLIPSIDLTYDKSIKHSTIEDSKMELLAILKEEPKPCTSETITLYRSEETVNMSLEVQAQSVVIGKCSRNNELEKPYFKNEESINRDSQDSEKPSSDASKTTLSKDFESVEQVVPNDRDNGCPMDKLFADISIPSNDSSSPKSVVNHIATQKPLPAKSPNQIAPTLNEKSKKVTTELGSAASNFTDCSPKIIPPNVTVRNDVPINFVVDISSELPAIESIIQDAVIRAKSRLPVESTTTEQLANSETSVVGKKNETQESSSPIVLKQPSTDNSIRSTVPQTPRREFAEQMETINFNTSNTIAESKILTEITKVFLQYIVFYNYLKQHQQVYMNSIKELGGLFPELVAWETEITLAEQDERMKFLSKKLASSLQVVCYKMQIDFDVNKWINHVHRNAQILIPSLTKSSLIILLYHFLNYNRDYYLTVPYLKKIWVHIWSTKDKIHELANLGQKTQAVQQAPKGAQMQQNQRLSTPPQQPERMKSYILKPPPPYPNNYGTSVHDNSGTANLIPSQRMNSNIQSNAYLINTENNTHKGARLNNQRNSERLNHITSKTIAAPDSRLLDLTNSALLTELLGSSCHNAQSANSPTVEPNNKSSLNILSNVLLDPNVKERTYLQSNQQIDNFKIRLPLSEPYDTSKQNSYQNEIESNNNAAVVSRAPYHSSQSCYVSNSTKARANNPIVRSAKNTVPVNSNRTPNKQFEFNDHRGINNSSFANDGMWVNVSPANSIGVQKSPSRNSESNIVLQSNKSSSHISNETQGNNRIGVTKTFAPTTQSFDSSHTFKAPIPVAQNRAGGSDICGRMLPRNYSANNTLDANESSMQKYLAQKKSNSSDMPFNHCSNIASHYQENISKNSVRIMQQFNQIPSNSPRHIPNNTDLQQLTGGDLLNNNSMQTNDRTFGQQPILNFSSKSNSVYPPKFAFVHSTCNIGQLPDNPPVQLLNNASIQAQRFNSLQASGRNLAEQPDSNGTIYPFSNGLIQSSARALRNQTSNGTFQSGSGTPMQESSSGPIQSAVRNIGKQIIGPMQITGRITKPQLSLSPTYSSNMHACMQQSISDYMQLASHYVGQQPRTNYVHSVGIIPEQQTNSHILNGRNFEQQQPNTAQSPNSTPVQPSKSDTQQLASGNLAQQLGSCSTQTASGRSVRQQQSVSLMYPPNNERTQYINKPTEVLSDRTSVHSLKSNVSQPSSIVPTESSDRISRQRQTTTSNHIMNFSSVHPASRNPFHSLGGVQVQLPNNGSLQLIQKNLEELLNKAKSLSSSSPRQPLNNNPTNLSNNVPNVLSHYPATHLSEQSPRQLPSGSYKNITSSPMHLPSSRPSQFTFVSSMQQQSVNPKQNADGVITTSINTPSLAQNSSETSSRSLVSKPRKKTSSIHEKSPAIAGNTTSTGRTLVSQTRSTAVPQIENTPVSQSGSMPVSLNESKPVSQTGSTSVLHTGSSFVSQIGNTPISPTRSTLVSQTGSTPVSHTGSSPVSHTGSTPVSQTGSTPISQSGSTPVSQTGSTPVSQTGRSPVSQTGSTPVSQTGSTPDQQVPPTLRNIKSPVYAPMLFSPSNYMDDTDESELTDAAENDIIDLTWLVDVDPTQLQIEMNEFFIKKEEIVDDEVILNQEQFPVSNCSALTLLDRVCICHKPAHYVCKCRVAMYCSEPCQMKDWRSHKPLCMRYRLTEGSES